MKDVLLANICGTYLETALAFDASHQNKATYNQICLHLRQLENIHQNRGTFRHKGKAARTLSAVSSNVGGDGGKGKKGGSLCAYHACGST